jgi:hypothetical protein
MLHELGNLWARNNETWIKQIFNNWSVVTLEQVDFAGYNYVFRDVKLSSRIGLKHTIPELVKGSQCGSYGGLTKTGEPCKKAGTNTGNRCSLHPCSRFSIAFNAGDTINEIKLNFGADHAFRPMPHTLPWSTIQVFIDGQPYQFLDLDGSISLVTGLAVINDCLASCKQFQTHNIQCQYGNLSVNPFATIQKFRISVEYYGPWRTSTNQDVAQDGYYVGDYTAGVWTK